MLSGVTFEIWRDGESLGSFETGELGEILLTGLTPGTYVVQEKFVGDEYAPDFSSVNSIAPASSVWPV